jgi:hypothetical protein
MNGITDYIISLINRYPHLPVFFFLSALFAITQLKYGWQAYHYKNEKYTRQYRIVNKITTVIFLLVVIVTIVLFVSCSKEDIADEDTAICTIIVYMAADNDLSIDLYVHCVNVEKRPSWICDECRRIVWDSMYGIVPDLIKITG